MRSGILEHVNITVTDPKKTADMLCELFGWKIRWAGPSSFGGSTVHVGTDEAYLAVYTPNNGGNMRLVKDNAKQGLNHIGIIVDDLDDVEKHVLNAGFQTRNHGDYEPGRRFYFNDNDGIEYEVVSYA